MWDAGRAVLRGKFRTKHIYQKIERIKNKLGIQLNIVEKEQQIQVHTKNEHLIKIIYKRQNFLKSRKNRKD